MNEGFDIDSIDVDAPVAVAEWEPDMIRREAVMRMTGWGKKYVAKLVAAGVLHTRRLTPKGWQWFSRREVEGLVTGKAES